jgi:hypothetical protein
MFKVAQDHDECEPVATVNIGVFFADRLVKFGKCTSQLEEPFPISGVGRRKVWMRCSGQVNPYQTLANRGQQRFQDILD